MLQGCLGLPSYPDGNRAALFRHLRPTTIRTQQRENHLVKRGGPLVYPLRIPISNPFLLERIAGFRSASFIASGGDDSPAPRGVRVSRSVPSGMKRP